MPGRDVRLFADVVSNRVEIVFGSKDLSEENITTTIKKFTDESFVIEKFESTDGETVVIVRFEDANEASKFIDSVSASSTNPNSIKKCVFNFEEMKSTAHMAKPLMELFVIILINLFISVYF